jgi:aspartyl protease family protein
MQNARIVTLALWLAATCLAPAAYATTVLVMSLEQGRAQLLVNGTTVRSLRAGQTSPEGVRLISADRTQALVEVDGRELALALGGSTVASAELKVDRSGHFTTTAYVNGAATQAVIDTGATAVAISSDEAHRLSIGYAGAPRLQIATAGGPKTGCRVNCDRARRRHHPAQRRRGGDGGREGAAPGHVDRDELPERGRDAAGRRHPDPDAPELLGLRARSAS